MERYALKRLIDWKSDTNRKPMIIRGARQVGKTWLMKEFGKTQFPDYAYFNFDENPRLAEIFAGELNIERIILSLGAESGKIISPENTLLIFDEIQEAPRAMSSLKYFNENAPEYAIVAAGSLLGVAMHQGTSFPVGKVNFMDLYPMNFREFLTALGEQSFADMLVSADNAMIKTFRDKYAERLKQYYYVGGMPEAVQSFVTEKDFIKVRKIQKELLNYYQQDFSKHAPISLVPRLNMVWQSIPMQLAKENKKFIYGQLREGARAKDFELAIQWLQDCGLIQKVNRIKKAGVPLAAYKDMVAFKIYIHDIGLLAAMSDLDARTIIDGNKIFTEFKGALTEQYAQQQLVSDIEAETYYFSAENARCEVDFIVSGANGLLPVEVKAEENLKSKSLRIFCEKNSIEKGIRLSMSDYREQDWMINIPLYQIVKLRECI